MTYFSLKWVQKIARHLLFGFLASALVQSLVVVVIAGPSSFQLQPRLDLRTGSND
jgi:hypothetical protein